MDFCKSMDFFLVKRVDWREFLFDELEEEKKGVDKEDQFGNVLIDFWFR